MKKTIVNIFILFFISIIIWFSTNYSYQKKFNSLEAEKNICQEQLAEKKQFSMSPDDASFIIQKDKELASVKNSLLYFSATTEKLTINQWKITVKFEGSVESASDVADLRLDLPEGLTVSDLQVGPAFPLYPRKVVTANYLLLTGLASINANQMIFGQPNKTFVEFTVQNMDNQLNKKQITVDKEATKIYLNGGSVLDSSKSASLIDLP